MVSEPVVIRIIHVIRFPFNQWECVDVWKLEADLELIGIAIFVPDDAVGTEAV
jgi:hypothetical protein